MSGAAAEILITRAEPGASRTAGRLQARGYTPVLSPLLAVEIVADAAPDVAAAQAVLITSPNGAEAYGRLHGQTQVKALCVGAATAEAARAAGFADILCADGDAVSLVRLARAALDPQAGELVWISGEDAASDVAASLGQAGFRARRAVLYRAVMAPDLPEAAARALRGTALAAALFHSARGAQAFAQAVEKAGLANRTGRLAAVCMSPRVAEAARALEWGSMIVADAPAEESLLAALDQTLGARRN